MSAGEKFANDFMATAGLLIQAPNAVEAKKELLELFKSATELAYKVWTRKNDVEVVHLSDFRSLDFDPKSEMMTHHALHNAELHKDENCLTGRPIILVASPAVVVRGRSDGTEYDLERVWKSAVVFMLRKEPSEKIKQEQKAVEAIIKKEQKQPEPEAVKVKKEEFESKWDKSSENGHEVVRYRD